jgi:hypothetical protein
MPQVRTLKAARRRNFAVSNQVSTLYSVPGRQPVQYVAELYPSRAGVLLRAISTIDTDDDDLADRDSTRENSGHHASDLERLYTVCTISGTNIAG